ncbi:MULTISPECIES: hypothetical protein [unclassified Sphingomonas]|uniref:hypothetical protein n=1 Tax=unclassified Sphingomonas TaxID=196159 RepID=UPI00226A6FED|nr:MULTISPECIES: hypothetical protein [unclassified Sphingomonas]
MNPLELVFGIVVVVTIAKLLRDRYHHQASTRPATDTIDTLRLQDEVRHLKERVQVLERVITDNHGSADLDRQIERLRDR